MTTHSIDLTELAAYLKENGVLSRLVSEGSAAHLRLSDEVRIESRRIGAIVCSTLEANRPLRVSLNTLLQDARSALFSAVRLRTLPAPLQKRTKSRLNR